MNFGFYQDLAVIYKRLNITGEKIKYYQKDSSKNPLSEIMVGLLFMEDGKYDAGLAKLQEFIYLEPDLIITNGVKKYVEQHTNLKYFK